MSFPELRLRRLRNSAAIRNLVREHRLHPGQFVYPLFVKEGLSRRRAIASMPGQDQHTLRSAVDEAKRCFDLGITGVILFGIPARKDASGREATNPRGIVPQVIARIKREVPKLLVISDVCLCEYTDHGHCGHWVKGQVANDSTLQMLAAAAVSNAEAGADVIAPSDMMDGRVRAIRRALDAKGFENTTIMSYAAKYNSAFYGPFRDAAENKPMKGDRAGYQMDAANSMEALREVSLDMKEGADLILVKPALAYLDVIRDVKAKFHCPTGAYQVSGEYSMIKLAAAKKLIDEKRAALESLTSIVRAGATFVVTYWAKDAARWLKK